MAAIGTVGWKRPGFRSLVNYIISEDREGTENTFAPIYHNIIVSNPEAAVKAFKEVEKQRRVERKDSIRVFHEFISFHPDSKPTAMELEDLAEQYIKLRSNGKEAIVFVRAHMATRAKHVHFAISGVDMQGRSMSLSDKDFLRIRLELEQYQHDKYPHLDRSLVYIDKERFKKRSKEEADKSKRSQRSYRQRLRTGGKTKKEFLLETFGMAAKDSSHFHDLKTRLEEQDISFYYSKHRLMGISYDGHHYRFSTLGIDPQAMRFLIREQINVKEWNRRRNHLLKARKRSKNERDRN